MRLEERKEARTYAWGYFALHADQWVKLLNFFLILRSIPRCQGNGAWNKGRR